MQYNYNADINNELFKIQLSNMIIISISNNKKNLR